MAIVLTNGTCYVYYSSTGATKKTTDINNAYQFPTVSQAIKGIRDAEGKTKNYYVYDTLTQRVLWKRMTREEFDEIRKERLSLSLVSRDKNGRIIRKKYSDDARKLIYNKAQGKCELCGRKILLEDMTIDHVKPLSMGGEDDVNNLACTCYPCNLFKGNILPDDFMERITEIFMYQTKKKCSNSIKRKIIYKLVESLC